MNEEYVKITIETEANTKEVIDITEKDIKLNGKSMTIPDCIRAIDIGKQFIGLVSSYAKEIILGTI